MQMESEFPTGHSAGSLELIGNVGLEALMKGLSLEVLTVETAQVVDFAELGGRITKKGRGPGQGLELWRQTGVGAMERRGVGGREIS